MRLRTLALSGAIVLVSAACSSSGEPATTIVTTEANARLSELHERMPVVFAPCDYNTWLDSAP